MKNIFNSREIKNLYKALEEFNDEDFEKIELDLTKFSCAPKSSAFCVYAEDIELYKN
ncbi:MAG: hypothetical protein AABX14_01460 [Candidatus Aenigmatarchaeota archaeon]